MTWALFGMLLITGADAGASDERVLEAFSWRTLEQTRQLLGGEVIAADQAGADEILKVENPKGKPSWLTILKIEKPKVSSPAYGIEGEVRYEGVEGVGLLEMWSHFGAGDEAFSLPARTYGTGLTAPLRDKSPWRPFRVSLALGHLKAQPESIEFKVVLPGCGTVNLRRVRLMQYSENTPWLADQGVDWSKFTAGFIVLGVGLALLVSQIVATAILNRAMTTCWIALRLAMFGQVLGAGTLAGGVYFASQPRTGMLGLAMVGIGALYMGVMWALVPWIHRCQGELDLRRIPTMEVTHHE